MPSSDGDNSQKSASHRLIKPRTLKGFRDYLPDFNFTVPEAMDFSVSNAIQWIQDTGIDGFRLDVAAADRPALNVDLVGPFEPNFYGFMREKDFYKNKNLRPADFR